MVAVKILPCTIFARYATELERYWSRRQLKNAPFVPETVEDRRGMDTSMTAALFAKVPAGHLF
ncbi:MAG: hypothetical protein ACYC3H_03925 [Bellilinea sp.]